MKYIIGVISAVAIALVLIFSPLASLQKCEVEYLRIHIRANSNSAEDQRVKYLVKDRIVEVLIPYLSDVETFEQAKEIVSQNFSLIESEAEDVLLSEGFSYGCRADIRKEMFPTRTYENLTLEEGEYEALILELGSGEGDNWWCIVFPAFCFTKSQNSDNIVYISKIWEIINSVI